MNIIKESWANEMSKWKLIWQKLIDIITMNIRCRYFRIRPWLVYEWKSSNNRQMIGIHSSHSCNEVLGTWANRIIRGLKDPNSSIQHVSQPTFASSVLFAGIKYPIVALFDQRIVEGNLRKTSEDLWILKDYFSTRMKSITDPVALLRVIFLKLFSIDSKSISL